MEDVFIQIGKGQQDDPVYVMNTAEKDCLDSFMAARNNALVWGKSNVDKSGKATVYDELNRPIVSSDGIIAQIERFATKMLFTRLNTRYFNKALQIMVSKAEKPTGNTFAFICNTSINKICRIN